MNSLFRGSVDKKVFDYVFWAILFVLINQTFHTIFPNVVNVLLSSVIVILLLLGWGLYSLKYVMPPLIKCFWFLIIYLVLVGFLKGWSFSHNDIGLMLMQDIRYVLLFLLGGAFSIHGNMRYFHEIMKVLAWISIVFAIPALLFFDYSVDSISDRSETWSMSYFYWWCSCSCFCYWGYYALFEKKDRFLGFGTLVVYGLLGVLFLKRSAVVNVLVIFVCYALFSKRIMRNLLTMVILGVALVGLLFFIKGDLVNNLFNLMSSRFDMGMDEFNRTIEAKLYFQEAGLLDIVFGNGIGHLFLSRIIRGDPSSINALHLGWANLIYKGGILYVLYYLCLYARIFKNIIVNTNKSNYERICYCVAISSLVSMFYEGSWTYTLLPFCISAPIYYAALNSSSNK